MTAPTDEDPHMVLHIYEGDGALVVREGGNMTIYGTQHPRLVAAFERATAGLPSDYAGLVRELRERAELRAEQGSFTKKNLVEWRAAEAIAALSRAPGASYFTWKHRNEDEKHRGFGKHHPGFKDDSGYVVNPLYLATPPAHQPDTPPEGWQSVSTPYGAPQPIGSDTCLLDGRAELVAYCDQTGALSVKDERLVELLKALPKPPVGEPLLPLYALPSRPKAGSDQ